MFAFHCVWTGGDCTQIWRQKGTFERYLSFHGGSTIIRQGWALLRRDNPPPFFRSTIRLPTQKCYAGCSISSILFSCLLSFLGLAHWMWFTGRSGQKRGCPSTCTVLNNSTSKSSTIPSLRLFPSRMDGNRQCTFASSCTFHFSCTFSLAKVIPPPPLSSL